MRLDKFLKYEKKINKITLDKDTDFWEYEIWCIRNKKVSIKNIVHPTNLNQYISTNCNVKIPRYFKYYKIVKLKQTVRHD